MQNLFKNILLNLFLILNIFTNFNYSSNADTFVYSGGCFWCTEADTEKLDGVSDVISGFTAGTTKDPKYSENVIHHIHAKSCSTKCLTCISLMCLNGFQLASIMLFHKL